MMTSSNGNIFRVTGPLCGEFTGPGEFPAQRPVTRSFDVFFDLRLNKRLSKQPWGWWFETLSWSLRRQCNVNKISTDTYTTIQIYQWFRHAMTKSLKCISTTNNIIRVHYVGILLRRTERPTPSWWLPMSWCQIGPGHQQPPCCLSCNHLISYLISGNASYIKETLK